MMALAKRCACCGIAKLPIAIISDPFADQSYGVCKDCMRPIHDAMYARIRADLGNPQDRYERPQGLTG